MKIRALVGTATAVLALGASQMILAPQALGAELSCNGGNVKCRVTVSLNPATHKAQVDFEGVKLERGFHNIHIFWHLPPNCSFNAASAGHGVLFKVGGDDDGQFFERFATDDDNDHPTPSPSGGKKYHWRAKNDSHSGQKYNYKIVFHCADGQMHVVDPWIQNG